MHASFLISSLLALKQPFLLTYLASFSLTFSLLALKQPSRHTQADYGEVTGGTLLSRLFPCQGS